MRDNRGTIIEVGQEVAYNLSGEIVKGKIKSITPKPAHNQWGGPRVLIEVELLHDARGHKVGWVSKVTSYKNMLVLLDEH